MRDVVLSNCEKNFLNKIVPEGHRLDGRNYNESRPLNIAFGSEYGSCIVSLGETKVLAQVSCEVVQPKQIRPNEGLLYINAEISPMAAPQFEANRQNDLSLSLNRQLEKCYKDSKCIDLESLCIVAEEKVWSIRVDIKVLNLDGNLIECASLATVTALAHFRRPDVTRSGDSVIIHDITEKDPIPTVLFHYPVCTTYAVFDEDILLADPTFLEETVCTSSTEETSRSGLLVVGLNQYKEVCILYIYGAALTNRAILNKALPGAAERCREIVDIVKKAIISDDIQRQRRVKINFSDIITQDHLLCLSKKDLTIKLKHYNADDDDLDEEEFMDTDSEKEPSKYDVVSSVPQTAEIQAKKGASQWIEISSDSEDN